MTALDQPRIDATGRVLHAPNPARLVDRVSLKRQPRGYGVLYLGGSWRRRAPRESYDVVITVCGNGEGFAPPDCATHIEWPLHDGGTVPVRAARALADETAGAVREGADVLVRCYTGQNRSGLVAALALCDLYSWDGARAVGHLRAIRSPHVLCNPAFEAYVLGLGD